MGENKKIKNAETSTYNNIKFRSKLEERVYRYLTDRLNVSIDYEKHTYDIIPAFTPTVFFYSPFVKSVDKVRKITYTPDLTFNYKEYFVIVECKGFPNDSYPLKRKLFRNRLEQEENSDKILFFEVKSVRDCDNLIKILNEKTK